jgi:uncharacterized membrane protein YccF (DUF307 family)
MTRRQQPDVKKLRAQVRGSEGSVLGAVVWLVFFGWVLLSLFGGR